MVTLSTDNIELFEYILTNSVVPIVQSGIHLGQHLPGIDDSFSPFK